LRAGVEYLSINAERIPEYLNYSTPAQLVLNVIQDSSGIVCPLNSLEINMESLSSKNNVIQFILVLDWISRYLRLSRLVMGLILAATLVISSSCVNAGNASKSTAVYQSYMINVKKIGRTRFKKENDLVRAISKLRKTPPRALAESYVAQSVQVVMNNKAFEEGVNAVVKKLGKRDALRLVRRDKSSVQRISGFSSANSALMAMHENAQRDFKAASENIRKSFPGSIAGKNPSSMPARGAENSEPLPLLFPSPMLPIDLVKAAVEIMITIGSMTIDNDVSDNVDEETQEEINEAVGPIVDAVAQCLEEADAALKSCPDFLQTACAATYLDAAAKCMAID
jgi:hypothetical protein